MKRKPTKTGKQKRLESYPSRMSPADVSEYWNCSENLVRELVKSGRLPAVDLAAPGAKVGYFKIARAAVAEFEDENRA